MDCSAPTVPHSVLRRHDLTRDHAPEPHSVLRRYALTRDHTPASPGTIPMLLQAPTRDCAPGPNLVMRLQTPVTEPAHVQSQIILLLRLCFNDVVIIFVHESHIKYSAK